MSGATAFDFQRIADEADTGRPTNPAAMEVPTVADEASYNALPYGKDYYDPEGNKRTKLYRVTDQASYNAIPDGSDYLDPEGNRRTRPGAENVSFGAQTLYEMANGDRDVQRRILEGTYGSGTVQTDDKGMFVLLPDGKRLRPSAEGGGFVEGLKRGAANTVATALPVAGAVGGAVAGAPMGGVGGLVGAGLGYAGGAEANRSILALAGYPSERTMGERAVDVAKEIAEGSAFEGGGRLIGAGIGAASGAIQSGVSGLKPTAQRAAQFISGIREADRPDILSMAEQGVRVPPHMSMPELPSANLIMREGKIYGHDPVTPSVENFGNRRLSDLLFKIGVPEEEVGVPLARTAAVDMVPAGNAAHTAYQQKLAASDAAVGAAFDDLAVQATARGNAAEAAREAALSTAEKALAENRATAQRVIDATWSDIQTTISDLQAGQLGARPGDLVRTVRDQIRGLREALGTRFREQYARIDEVAGGAQIDALPVAREAENFLKLLPDDISRNHPALIQALADLRDTGTLTYGQAHHLRSMLRDLSDWQTLAPSFRNGQWKYFSGVLDQALHNPANPAPIQQAVRLLDATDREYAAQMARFKSPTVQRIADWTEANLPPSPGMLAREVLEPGQEETRRELKSIMGQSPWNAVIGADMQAALDASKTVHEGVYDASRFVDQFLQRERQGILADYPRQAADLMRRQAQYVQAITSGGENSLNLKLRPGETFETAMQRAAEAAQEIERQSKANPLKVMKDELAAIEKEKAAAIAAGQEGAATNPLHRLLSNPSALVENSVRQIVQKPELTIAAWKEFRNQPEVWSLIRNAWVRDILTGTDVNAAKGMYRKVTELTPMQQQIGFGATKDDVLAVSRQLNRLLESADDFGASLHGTSAVTNPKSSLVPGASELGKPGIAKRITLGFGLKIMTDMLTQPGLVKFLAGSITGTPEQQAIARELIAWYAQRGSPIGAGVGATIMQSVPGERPPPPAPKDWREEFQREGALAPAAGAASQLAAMGRFGDTQLAHVTPEEMARLKEEGGAGTINPMTGLPEFYEGGAERAGGSGRGGEGLGSPGSAEAAGMAGAAMGGGMAAGIAPGAPSMTAPGATLGATQGAMGLTSAPGFAPAPEAPGFVERAILGATPGTILGMPVNAALGPVASALSFVSGKAGGPTTGSLIDRALNALGPRGPMEYSTASGPLGEDYRQRRVG